LTLYYYTPDKDASVTCNAACLAIWPPLTGTTAPTAPAGVTGTFSTDPLPSGGSIITYNGWPLYLFVSDKKPGDTTGEDLNNQGTHTDPVWFVATPGLKATPTGQ